MTEKIVPNGGIPGRVGMTILGSTGSVGSNTIDPCCVSRRFQGRGADANRNAKLLAVAGLAVRARFAAVADPSEYAALKDMLAGSGIEVARRGRHWSNAGSAMPIG